VECNQRELCKEKESAKAGSFLFIGSGSPNVCKKIKKALKQLEIIPIYLLGRAKNRKSSVLA
jgi:hypothetical protein